MKPPPLSALWMLGILNTCVYGAERTKLRGGDALDEVDSHVGIHLASVMVRTCERNKVVGLRRVVSLYLGAWFII